MGTEKFCLRWNDFESNISVAFRELRDDKDFFDVTLACDDDQIQAHKVILSACSPFFRNILRRNPHQHPLLYLKGVKYGDLQSVLNFMYHGEVNVAQEELNSFLAVAEDLRVKGLTQNQSGGAKKDSYSTGGPKSPVSKPIRPPPSEPSPGGPPAKRPRPITATQPVGGSVASTAAATTAFSSASASSSQDDDDIQEVVPVKSEPRDTSSVPSGVGDSYSSGGGGGGGGGTALASSNSQHALVAEDDGTYDESYDDYGQYDQSYDGAMGDPNISGDGNKGLQNPEDLDEYIQQGRADGGNFYFCTICNNFSHKGRTQLRNHVEMKHFPGAFTYSCPKCPRVLESKKALENHTYRHHKQSAVVDLQHPSAPLQPDFQY